MADGFRIDAAWLDALDRYVEGLLADTAAAAEVTAAALYRDVREEAQASPDWVNMADFIEAWSMDGKLVIGVQDNAMVSQAFALEYGDENREPSPMFRTMNRLVPKTQDRFTRELRARRGAIDIPGVEV